jgi:hypothetical protein
MKIRNTLLLLFVFVFTISIQGCKKEWLEIRSSKGLVIPSTLVDAEAILNRTSIMNSSRATPLGDIAAGDFVVPPSYWASLIPWQVNAYLWQDEIFIDNVGLENWGNSYQQIFYTNLVLDILSKIDKNNDSNKYNNVRGRALFFRSWAYFQLAQVYCLPYSEQNKGKFGLPLREGIDLDVALHRSTLEQTYKQIKTDLEEAVSLLDNNSENIYQPNKKSALMMLARVNLIMQDFKDALMHSDEAIKIDGTLLDYNKLNLSLAYPFKENNTEVIFDASMGYAQIISDTRIDVSADLLKTYEDNDLRKKGFFTLKNGNHIFKGSYIGSGVYFAGLAKDELYLIRSESYLRMGDADKSLADLNYLLVNRYSDFQPIKNLSTGELMKRILLERRKELLLRCIAWSDLKRLNLDKETARTITKSVDGRTYILEPNSERYAMPIPKAVVDLGKYEQN